MATAYAAPSHAADTTVTSSIGSVMSLLTTSGTVTLNATPTAGGVQTTTSDTVTISPNNSAGYTQQLAWHQTEEGQTTIRVAAVSLVSILIILVIIGIIIL